MSMEVSASLLLLLLGNCQSAPQILSLALSLSLSLSRNMNSFLPPQRVGVSSWENNGTGTNQTTPSLKGVSSDDVDATNPYALVAMEEDANPIGDDDEEEEEENARARERKKHRLQQRNDAKEDVIRVRVEIENGPNLILSTSKCHTVNDFVEQKLVDVEILLGKSIQVLVAGKYEVRGEDPILDVLRDDEVLSVKIVGGDEGGGGGEGEVAREEAVEEEREWKKARGSEGDDDEDEEEARRRTCPACKDFCAENGSKRVIQCDICDDFYHVSCAGFKSKVDVNKIREWFCYDCLLKAREDPEDYCSLAYENLSKYLRALGAEEKDIRKWVVDVRLQSPGTGNTKRKNRYLSKDGTSVTSKTAVAKAMRLK